MANKLISILGCGWLGLPLAERLTGAGHSVKGSTTSEEKLTLLRRKGIDAHLLQLSPDPVGDLTALVQADTLLIDIPPKAGKMGDSFHPQQVRSIVEAVQGSRITHVIYVSSTSVYAEANGIAREEDVTALAQTAAPALFQAETYVQALEPQRLVTILRCGGLMGYDRIPGKYVAGRTVDSGAVPVNYIHRDDAVDLLLHLIEKPLAGVFNAVAPEHPAREAIYRRSCMDFGYTLPTFVEPNTPVPYKVVSPDKLIQATGYQFHYPNPLDFYYSQ
ncbi:NAD(P)H-binding protein [Spirosoma utsteinense]|uniref:Nucleoside-diphosphate-sugar epimerase n=1 Tax=Spirosoma utsteinense TaxID=2585773 RepID=A0ABR6W5K3_9BACT|nr:NAD(P)H-binding protein [Spirosoma utsteinense]MBC3785477.1 nucleoside-diphosphate-sugar epimerase [Spirosoma utsteinense]MBC3791494.1 nucleoside-diphosphate-sugar epimerase [Spirosoma utsteinense]